MFEIIPKEKIVITTKKTNEEINASLVKVFGQESNEETKLMSSQSNFVIQKTFRVKSLFQVIAKGTIIIGSEKNFIRMEITALDTHLKRITFLWYVLNAFLLVFMLYLVFMGGYSSLLILVPIVLILIGYFLTTAFLRGAMDGIIKDITKEVK